jgi:hypothetical protein
LLVQFTTNAVLFQIQRDKAALDFWAGSFELPRAGRATIEVFDLLGRKTDVHSDGEWSSGSHEVILDTRPLSSGVYTARLTTNDGRATLRLVLIR